jgi:hypothetical protein
VTTVGWIALFLFLKVPVVFLTIWLWRLVREMPQPEIKGGPGGEPARVIYDQGPRGRGPHDGGPKPGTALRKRESDREPHVVAGQSQPTQRVAD